MTTTVSSTQQVTAAPPRNRPLLVIAAILVMLGVVFVAALIVGIKTNSGLTTRDIPTLDWFAAHRTDAATSLMTLLSTISGEVVLPLLVVLVAGIWWWRSRDWRGPIVLIAAMVLATVVSLILKYAVARERPPLASAVPPAESTLSFPSGHTLEIATFLGIIGYCWWAARRGRTRLVVWIVVTVVGALVVGYSRLYLGHHYLTDVLAAFGVAAFVIGVVLVLDVMWWRPRTLKGSTGQREGDASPPQQAGVDDELA